MGSKIVRPEPRPSISLFCHCKGHARVGYPIETILIQGWCAMACLGVFLGFTNALKQDDPSLGLGTKSRSSHILCSQTCNTRIPSSALV